MAITKTTDRLEVIEALMNVWLKDSTVYCNNCGENYNKFHYPCCEDPQMGTNIQHTRSVILENELRREELKRDDGATDRKTMRLAFSLPPRLYQFIKNYFAGYNEQFPKDVKELHRLMRRFKKFCIPKVI